MAMPGSPYHVSQVISHNPGHVRGARLGDSGIVELAATNN